MGYLVFDYSGDEPQSVLISEIELVELVDNNTTNSEIIGPININISRADYENPNSISASISGADTGENPGSSPGATLDDSDNTDLASNGGFSVWWIIAIALLAAAMAAVLLISSNKRKKNNEKPDSEETPPNDENCVERILD
jgi:hypothetical protein